VSRFLSSGPDAPLACQHCGHELGEHPAPSNECVITPARYGEMFAEWHAKQLPVGEILIQKLKGWT
jgi:hypothetical protein